MERKIFQKKLSKKISYILRHHPEEFGLQLDEYGWIELELLLEAIRKEQFWQNANEQDVVEMMEAATKKRFELKNGFIRAAYGHSIPAKIAMQRCEPPEVLFHGTARRFMESIRNQGLIPKGRQYVHLSATEAIALEVGRRRDSEPVVLTVKAREAFDHGVDFYLGNGDIWLAEPVPPEYITEGI